MSTARQTPSMPDLRGPALLRGLAGLGLTGPIRRWQDWRAREWQYETQRAYLEAAGHNSKTGGWKSITADPDDVARADATTAAGRVRYLVQNTPYAAKCISELTNIVVGQGIRRDLRIRWSKEERINTRINSQLEDRLRRWQDVAFLGRERHLFDGQRLWLRTTAQDGEALVRMVYRPQAPVLPLRLQIIGRERLVGYGLKGVAKGNEVLSGVEYDPDGEIVAYHIEANQYRYVAERVLAPFVNHHIRVDRPGQTRGITWFAPVVSMLNMLQELTEYKIIQAKVQAAIAVLVSDGPDGAAAMPSLPTPTGGTKTDTASQGPSQFIVPGMVHRVGKGQVSTLTPSPSGDLDPLVKTLLRGIGCGTWLSYERLSGDYREVSFAGGRLVENVQKDTAEVIWAWQCRGLESWIHRAWMDAESTFQGLPANLPTGSDPYAVTFSRPQWRLGANPLQEAKAIAELLSKAQTSVSRELAARGHSLDEIVEDFRADRQKLGAVGIELYQLLGLEAVAPETPAP